jgi:DeoR/GlpR family transcriptional regulator of sugar metabolism
MSVHLRRRQLLEAVERAGRVEVRALAAELGCSEMTVRRDLHALDRDGALRRVHGGAVAVHLRGDERPYAIRALEDVELKRAIGRAAGALIADGETVVLDSGTTAVEVARALRGRPVTVLSLGLRAIFELADDDAVRLIAPGGDVRPGELVFTGELAEAPFDRLRFDTFVLGGCGLAVAEGVTTHVQADARIKRRALAAARRTIVVADSAKLGRVAFARVCELDAVERLVTDARGEEVAPFVDAGLGVVHAG